MGADGNSIYMWKIWPGTSTKMHFSMLCQVEIFCLFVYLFVSFGWFFLCVCAEHTKTIQIYVSPYLCAGMHPSICKRSTQSS